MKKITEKMKDTIREYRGIKFRVFDKREKEMHEVVSIWGFPEIGHITVPDGDSVFTLFNNFQLMQFTGLKDKNGVDIYEGDIVLFPNNSKVHIVDFYQSGFVLKSVDGQIIVYNIKPLYIEVVGNIYENPEMISNVVLTNGCNCV